MKLSPKILKNILESNREFFEKEILSNITEKQLEKEFDSRRQFFDNLYLRDLIGYIPASLNEPTLKIFEEHGELLERWLLWQSWYLNRKAIRDPLKLPFYDGAMLYIKVLHTMATIHKKPTVAAVYSKPKPDKPWVETAMEDLAEFNKSVKEYAAKSYQADQNSNPQSTEDGKAAARQATDIIEG